MAHKQKYTKGAAAGLTRHYERHQGREGVRYKSREIDPSRSALNYNLGPDRGVSQTAYIARRVGEVRHIVRKDVNVMVDWVVTLPRTLEAGREREFFREAYAFMRDRYGGEANVVSAWVHMDETQPHMHFAFVPVVEDKRRGGEKLCAKEAVDRRDLQTFHRDLQRSLEGAMGIPVEVLNGATREGNRAVDELKRGSALERLEGIRAEAERAGAELAGLRAEAGLLRISRDEMASARPVRTLTGAVKGVSVEQVEALRSMALGFIRLEREHDRLRARFDELKAQVPALGERLEAARDKAELASLREALGRSAKLREAFRDALGRDPLPKARGRGRGR